ncbi:hypothetical protein [Georgenia sp. SUBG003]|uniref:hypothetical protein n=1 Tax=Georgenia sp. SUBG003 TaxID=1497974 RepID=UPI0004D6140C|nr:hypothetical protein DA06_25465 [Georgenia sp. SUBG003]
MNGVALTLLDAVARGDEHPVSGVLEYRFDLCHQLREEDIADAVNDDTDGAVRARTQRTGCRVGQIVERLYCL